MALSHHPWIVWSRQSLAWSNSRTAWAERAALLLVVVGVVGLGWVARGGSLSQQVGFGVGLALVIALLARRGWVKLFGPILVFDLVRSARRYRLIEVRALYALALLVLLALLYYFWLASHGYLIDGILPQETLPAAGMAEFSYVFFAVFIGFQLAAVFLLTPAYVAGAVAEEKERETLPALFATDLRDREIVFGLLLARLANLGMVLLAGLPVFSALQFLGGVEPDLALVGFAFVGLTLLGLAGVSFFFSVQARRPRQAILRTYLVALGYLVVSAVAHFLALPYLVRLTVLAPAVWADLLWLEDVVRAVSAGDVFAVWADVWQGLDRSVPLRDLLFDALGRYAVFHGLVLAGGSVWAVTRLRGKALGEDGGGRWGRRGAMGWKGLWLLSPPDVGARPVLWKEVHVESGSHRGWLGWLGIGVLAAALLWPAFQLAYLLWPRAALSPTDRMAELVNWWVRALSVVLGTIALLQVAVHAAGRVSGELDRRTLDGLRATPLDYRRILFGKWLGSILSPRGLGTFLVLTWAVAFGLGSLHPLALPCFAGAWLVYAGFAAGLGLFFSVIKTTTLRSVFWTLLALLVVSVLWPLAVFDLPEGWLNEFQRDSLYPPLALGILAFSPGEFEHWTVGTTVVGFAPLLLSLTVWALFGGGLWLATCWCYRRRFGPWIDPTKGSPIPAPAAAPVPPARVGAWLRPWLAENFGRSAPWGRRLVQAALVLLPAGLLAGRFWQLHRAAEREHQQLVAAMDLIDPNWRLDDLEASRAVVPDEENGGHVVIAMNKLMPKDWYDPKVDKAQEKLLPQHQLNAEQVRLLRATLDKVAAAVAEARRLKDRPRGRLPVKWSPDGISTILEHTQSARTVANVLTYDVRLRAQEGDADGAAESCLAILNAARAVGDEPTLISNLVRIAISHIAAANLERVLAQGQPAGPTLERLQHLLEDETRFPLLWTGLRGERAALDRLMDSIRRGDTVLPHLLGRPQRALRMPLPPQRDELLLGLGDSLLAQQAEMLTLSNDLVKAAEVTDSGVETRLGMVLAGLPKGPRTNVVGMLMPATGKVAAAHRRQRAVLACAAVGAAVERYRQAHGRWPDRLADLVPDYLKAVPLDSYDEKPLRYKRLADGVLIYSTGPDGQDHGGKLNREQPFGAGTDMGFQLWDVDKRRQPPPSPPAARDDEP